MQPRVIIIGLVLVIGLLFAAGCTVPTSTGTQTAGTAGSTPDVTGAQSGVTAAGNLVPTATDVIPDYNMIKVDVGEKDYLGVIPVIFQGGLGLGHVRKIDVTLYRSDGQVLTGTIGTSKGSEADLQGTKQTDRVTVYVSMDNGQTFKTNDVLSPYRTRR